MLFQREIGESGGRGVGNALGGRDRRVARSVIEPAQRVGLWAVREKAQGSETDAELAFGHDNRGEGLAVERDDYWGNRKIRVVPETKGGTFQC